MRIKPEIQPDPDFPYSMKLATRNGFFKYKMNGEWRRYQSVNSVKDKVMSDKKLYKILDPRIIESKTDKSGQRYIFLGKNIIKYQKTLH